MRERIRRRNTELYRQNVQMLLLCGLMVFWLLASPIIPYEFNVARPRGLALFVALEVVLTALLGALGVLLNELTARETRITPATVRAALRRPRRR